MSYWLLPKLLSFTIELSQGLRVIVSNLVTTTKTKDWTTTQKQAKESKSNCNKESKQNHEKQACNVLISKFFWVEKHRQLHWQHFLVPFLKTWSPFLACVTTIPVIANIVELTPNTPSPPPPPGGGEGGAYIVNYWRHLQQPLNFKGGIIFGN